MIKLKNKPEKLIAINCKVTLTDKALLTTLGGGKYSVGLRTILYSIREDLVRLAEEEKKSKKAS